jgi:hypothetical protein
VPGPLGQLVLNVEEVMRHLALESVDKPLACRSAPDPRDNARTPSSGRRALFLGCYASERVDRNPRYGSKRREFYDWTQQARSIVVSLVRGSAPLGQRSHPVVQYQGGALHRSDWPAASPPSVEQPSSTTMDPLCPK